MEQAASRQAHRRATRAKVRLAGLMRRRRGALLVGTALQATALLVLALPAAAQPAPNAQPQGGRVVGGSATITQTATLTTINQSTQRAAINWTGFNVGSNQTVDFNQPSSTSSTLNRVNSPDPSQIAGHINANGTVVLVNQNGVVFDQGAQVNVGGLMVSTAGISTRNYMAGKMAFDRSGNPNAAVVNNGNITVKGAGLAALVAPQVANSGVINARLGHVVLAGAQAATLDLYGDGLVSIDVSKQVTQVPLGPDGKPVTALITNTGTILAAGGTVQLTARAVDGVVQNLVAAGGTVSADTIGSHTGTVLISGVGGSVVVTGTLTAEGRAPGTAGGAIGVNATDGVTLANSSRLDASGRTGGGLVAIGTTLKRAAGGPSVTGQPTAKSVTVAKGAVVAADATAKGDGGRITVLSMDSTVISGTLTAKGGPQGGNGGLVEVSSAHGFAVTGVIDVSARLGNLGTILLDPDNLTIVGSGGNLDGSFTGTVTAGEDAGSSDSLSASVLDGFTGNVLLQASTLIDVTSSFSIAAGSLTMEAGQAISVEAGVSVGASGQIILATGGAGPGTPPAALANPVITIAGTVASSGGAVSLLSGAGGTISLGNAGSVAVANGQTVTLQADTLVAASGAQVSAPTGVIEIAPATSGSAMDFSGTGAGTLTVTQADLGLMSAGTIRLGAATIGGTQTTTAGPITFDAGVDLTGIASTLDLRATGNISRSTDSVVLTVGTLTGSAGGDLNLAVGVSTGNVIGTVGSFSVGANNQFELLTSGGVIIAGPVNAGTLFYAADVSASNPTIAVTGSIGATGSAILSSIAGTISVSGTINTPALTIGTYGTLQITGSSATLGQTGGTLALGAAGGATEVNTGTILAGTIVPVAGIGLGTISLLGIANTVSNLVSLNANGDFLLAGSKALTVSSTLSATGSIYLQTSDTTSGITVGAAGSVIAGANSLVSFQTDKFVNNGTVTGGTMELAPNTGGGTVTLGASGTGLSLPSLSGIGVTKLRAGAVTLPNGTLTTTAGSIAIGGAFGASTVALELDSTGAIGGSGFAVTASTLTGSAGGDTDLSNGGNAVGTLGNFSVTNSGSFNLLDTGSIAVTGTVSAANATISAGTIGVSGIVIASSGSLALATSAGALALTGNALLNGGTVSLASHTGLSEANTSKIIASSFTASAAAGSIALISPSNTIGTVTGLSANGGGVTLIVDPTMVLTGPIIGDNLFFEVAVNGGTLQIGSATAGVTMTATAASNPTISLVADNITEWAATSALSATDGSNAGTVEIAPFTSATPVSFGGTFGPTGTLVVDQTLLGDISTGIGTGGLLRVGTFTGGSITAGNISLDGSVNLGVVAPTVEFDSAGSISEAGSIALTVGTLTGTAAAGVTLSGTSNAVGTLGTFGVSSGDFTLVDTGTLIVAGSVAATNISLDAGSVVINGTLSAGTLLSFGGTLGSAGVSVLENAAASINAGTISSNGTLAGGLALNQGSNTIGALGTITAASGTIAVADTGSLSVAGVVTGPVVSISAGTIGIPGTLHGTTGVILGATVGGVAESGNGSIITPLLQSSGTIVGGVTLGGTNAIRALDGIAVSGGSLVVNTTGLLTVEATETAPNVSLNAETISIIGTLNAGTVLTLGASAGGIIETGVINAATLTSNGVGTGTIVGGATLTGSNTIGVLGTFTVSGGDFSLTDTGSLSVAGVVTGPAIALNAGTIGITGFVDAATALGLGASAGGITETGSITADTFLSLGTIVGGATLTGTNTIATLGMVTTSGGDFSLTDTGSLSVAGVIGAPNITLNAGTIGIGGALNAGTMVALGASAGGIIEAGTIVAATLSSAGTVAGGVTLTGSNTIGALGRFVVNGGNFTLSDNGTLDIIGFVSGPNISLNAGSIIIDGTLSAGALLSFGASLGTGGVSVLENASASINTGTVSSDGTLAGGLALNQGANTIGALGTISDASGTIAVADTGSLSVAGVVTGPVVSISAGTIGIPGTLHGITGVILGASAGGIAESGNGSIITPLLQGVGTIVGGVTLDGTNTIGALDGIAVSGGNLVVDDTGLLTVDATETAPNVSLNAGTISIIGTLNAGTVVALGASTGGIAETGVINAATLTSNGVGTGTIVGGATLTGSNTIGVLGTFAVRGGDFSFTDTGSLSVAGLVGAPDIALSAGTIGIGGTLNVGTILALGASAGGITETGVINAATLTSNGVGSGTIVGGATLTGTNTIATLGTLVTSGGDFSLTDTGSLSVSGVVTAPNITLNAGTIGIGGFVNAASVLALGASIDGITETGSITAGTLISHGTIAGGATLTGSNTIGVLGTFATGSGDFILYDTGSLSVAGLVGAPNITLNAGTIGIGGTLNAGTLLALGASAGGITETGGISAATLTSNGVGSGTIVGGVTLTGTNTIGVLGTFAVSGGNLSLADTGSLSVVGVVTGPTISLDAGTIGIAGFVDAATELDLGASAGGITESGSITTGTLAGLGTIVGGATLTGTNTIGVLGGVVVNGGDFTLNDTGSLSVAGLVRAPNIALNTGTIGIGGTLSAGMLLILGASAGGITETGVISAATLTSNGIGTGTIVGGATLTGSNTIGVLGSFAVSGGNLSLADTGSLSVAGVVTGPTIVLDAGTIGIAGFVHAATELDLGASAGGITEPGSITASTLASLGTIVGGATLTGTNSIVTLGTVTTSGGGFSLNATGSLTVGGVVTAPNITLSAGTLGIVGFINAETMLAFGASAGGITESGSITAGTLASQGTITGGASLIGTNTIATVGSIAVGSLDFDLVDTGHVNVAGPVTAAGNVSISTTGTYSIFVGGSIGAGGTLSLTSGSDGISLNSGALVTAPTINLNSGAGGIAIANNAVLGNTGAVVNITGSGAITEDSLGTVIAGTLQSSGNVANTVSLTGANTIASLGSFTVTGTHDFLLTDTGSLAVIGNISAQAIVLRAGTIGLSGTLSTPGTADLSTTSGGIAETGGGVIDTGFMQSSLGIAGGATLTGSNTIAGIGLLTVTGGNLTLDNTGSVLISGNVSAPNILLNAGSVLLTGTLTAETLVALAAPSGGFVESSSGGPVTGAITAPTLTSNGIGTGTIVGGASLTGPNTIATLSTMVVSGGDFSFKDTGSLSVGGSVSAPNITLNAGMIGIGGTVTAGTLLALGAGTGGITESGAIIAGTLTVITTGAGDVTLGSAANQIGVAAGVSLASGNFVLVDDPTLVLTGTHSATTLFYNVNAVGGTLQVGSASAGATLTAGSGGRVSLVADNITESAAQSTIVATGGTVEIAPTTAATPVNLGGTIGSAGTLLVDPTLLGDISTGTLRIGSHTGGGTTAGPIALGGAVNLGAVANTLELDSSGGIAEPSSISLTVGTLIGTAGGTVSLLGTSNAMGVLGNFTLTGNGDFDLADTQALTVGGTISVPGVIANIFLQAPTVTIGANGMLSASGGAGGVGIQTDQITVASGGSVSADVLYLAPNTQGGTVTLGATGSGLSLPSVNGLSVSSLYIGADLQPGAGAVMTRAGSIAIAGSFDASSIGRFLVLDATGAVTQTAPLTAGGALSGTAESYALLNTSNNIRQIEDMQATSGSLGIVTSNSLTALGLQASGNIYLASSNANGITVSAGMIAAGTGTIGLQTDALIITAGTMSAGTFELAPYHSGTLMTLGASGGLSLADLSRVSASLVRLGAIHVPGTVSATTTAGSIVVGGAFGSDSVPLELDSLGGITGFAGQLTASTLTGIAGGSVALTNANSIGVLGDFTVTNAGFALTDSQPLTVLGSVSAGSAATLRLTTTSGTLTIGAGGTMGVLNAGTVALTAAGAISEPNGSIVANTLMVATTGPGDATLTSATNQIGTISGASIVNGNLIVIDDPTMVLTGAQSANNLFYEVNAAGGTIQVGSNSVGVALTATAGTSSRISLIADNISEGTAVSTIIARGGAVELATFSPGTALSLGGSSGDVFTAGVFSTINAGTVVVGQFTDVPNGSTLNTTANSIAVAGSIDLSGGATTLALYAQGTISEPTGTLTVGTLVGTAAVANLITTANQVGALGSFATTGGFLLNDSGSLDVTGRVTSSAVSLAAGTVTVNNSIIATTGLTLGAGTGGIALDAGAILSGTTVDLSASGGGITQSASSTLIANTILQSSFGVTGAVSLSGANTIAALGNFAVTGAGFALTDTEALTVLGSVSAGPASTLSLMTTFGTLAIGATGTLGALNAGTVALTAAAAITEPDGSIVANTLTVATTGVGDVTLNSATNQIGTISGAGVNSGNLVVIDDPTMVLTGTQSANNLFYEVNAAGSTIQIGSNSIGATLTAIAGGNPRISLVADRLTEGTAPSTITATGGTVEVAPFTVGTAISLAGSAGGHLLVDATFIGDLSTGSLVVGRFTDVPNGGTLNTSAGGITVDGLADLTGRATTLGLYADNAITEPTGTIIVGTITGGNSLGDFSLTNGNNIIAASTGITAGGGDLLLVDNAPALVLGGTYDASRIYLVMNTVGGTLQVGSSTMGATMTASNGGTSALQLIADTVTHGPMASTLTASASGAGISIAPFTAGTAVTLDATLLGEINTGTVTIGQYVVLIPNTGSTDHTAGDILIGSAVDLTGHATELVLSAQGSITESGGTLVVGTLISNALGTTSLDSPSNAIGTVAAAQSDGFDLKDSIPLTISGYANGYTTATVLDTGGSITVSGSLAAARTSLTASDGISIPGTINAGLTLNLTTNSGTISETGTVFAGTLTGGSMGMTTLSGATTIANQIGTLGDFSAAGFILVSGRDLIVAGTLTAGATAVIAAGETVSVPGSIVSTHTVSISGGTLNISGLVTDGGAGTTTLVANDGTVTETGTLIAGTLRGSAIGDANFAGASATANQVAILDNFTATGLTLRDGVGLTIGGVVNAGTTASLTSSGSIAVTGSLIANVIELSAAGPITIPGLLADGNSVTLLSGSSISETGTLIADLLTGSAVGSASFTGADQVATLGSFSVSGSSSLLLLNDGTGLTVNGPLSAGRIVINVGSNQLTLADGVTIATDGVSRPPGTTFPPADAPANGGAGASLMAGNVVQNGSATVTARSGGASTLQITSGSNIELNNLVANGTWLILQMPGNGRAGGSIAVSALDLNYTTPGGGGSANLFGTINGITGQAAAGQGNIQPVSSSFYQFNNCPIHSINCVLLPPLTIPVLLPYNTLFFAQPTLPTDDPDLILIMPDVWKQDY